MYMVRLLIDSPYQHVVNRKLFFISLKKYLAAEKMRSIPSPDDAY